MWPASAFCLCRLQPALNVAKRHKSMHGPVPGLELRGAWPNTQACCRHSAWPWARCSYNTFKKQLKKVCEHSLFPDPTTAWAVQTCPRAHSATGVLVQAGAPGSLGLSIQVTGPCRKSDLKSNADKVAGNHTLPQGLSRCDKTVRVPCRPAQVSTW